MVGITRSKVIITGFWAHLVAIMSNSMIHAAYAHGGTFAKIPFTYVRQKTEKLHNNVDEEKPALPG